MKLETMIALYILLRDETNSWAIHEALDVSLPMIHLYRDNLKKLYDKIQEKKREGKPKTRILRFVA